MIRPKSGLAGATIHRTCRPLYEQHQATAFATFLDPTETGKIYSGMVARKSGADTVMIADGATANVLPFGIFALDRNDDIDDLEFQDSLFFTVWQGGPDAYFTVDTPAFDASTVTDVNTTGVPVKMFAGTSTSKGKLVAGAAGSGGLDATAKPVAELIQVVSATRIIIRLAAPAAL